MKKFMKQLAIFAVVLGIALVIGDVASAAGDGAGDGAGEGLRKDFITAITGSLGTTAGLGVSLVGLYMWIWNQVSWGIVVALGGALLTAFPGIYKSIGKFGTSAFSNSASGLSVESVKIDK